MTKKEDSVYVVDIIGSVVANMALELGIEINYAYGDAINILQNLKDKDNSVTMKDTKYVLVALYMPFTERRGATGLYADCIIRRITIAALTNPDNEPMARYQNVFKTILYPVYESFLRNFAKDDHISSKDPNSIVHTKVDVLGTIPISGMNDFVDCINLDNVQFLINSTKYC